MAFMAKNVNGPQGTTSKSAILDQYVKVTQATAAGAGIALPASTTGQLFRVRGGRVLVKALIGEVTTVIQTQADNVKVSVKKLDNASAAVGTAVDVCANVDVTAMAVGSHYFVEGDGTAGVLSTAGAILVGPNSGWWIAEQGEIYLTASATNTGAVKWDLYYQPLDPGAYVEPAALSSGILTAAI